MHSAYELAASAAKAASASNGTQAASGGAACTHGGYHIDVESLDGEAGLSLDARVGDGTVAGSAFRTLAQANDFFQAGADGYSLDRQRSELKGLRLETFGWDLQPLDVQHVTARFFDNPERFPYGTNEFDSAFIMQNVNHEWRMCPAPAG